MRTHIRDVGDPDTVWRIDIEALLQMVRRHNGRFAVTPHTTPIANLGAQAITTHQAIHAMLAAALAQIAKVMRDLAIAIDATAFQPALLDQS